MTAATGSGTVTSRTAAGEATGTGAAFKPNALTMSALRFWMLRGFEKPEFRGFNAPDWATVASCTAVHAHNQFKLGRNLRLKTGHGPWSNSLNHQWAGMRIH